MADNSSGPGNNIFTVLAFVAFVALLIGVGYTWMRLQAVTGSVNPFG
ncbi:hypothetical protein [Algisphaera agarilytica]|uniref:Uncharacterized protein n=1 Tax=Algisphaera agarilytica TaxID=1385975 RepID=A0A7X0HB07_9BACT|nr:hypothetical protein [Algisphaera agarilytica]MBB6431406.1 hypothetical protein [Algisphaera agarilytica]